MRSTLHRLLAVAAIATLALAGTATPAVGQQMRAEVDPALLSQLGAQGSAGFLVYLRDRADLTMAPAVANRAAEVYQRLTATAERSQQGLRAELARSGRAY